MDISDLIPAHIFKIAPYVPGKPIEELQRELGIADCIKMASNENPLGPSPKAVEAMQHAISNAHIYPDGESFKLRTALAQKYDLSIKQVLVGNGSNEAIDTLMRTVLTSDDEVILSQYSFIAYKITALSINVKCVIVPPKSDYSHDLEAMADAITPKTKFIVIDNPNNPTGTMVDKNAFDAFMKRVPERVLVAVDEAYDDYVETADFPNSLQYLKAGRRIVIFKTFSKIYGLGGIRLGCGLTHEAILDAVNRVRQPFNVNAVAQAAGVAALTDLEHIRRSKEVNSKGKASLYKAFDDMGVAYIPSQTNFVTIDLKRDSGPVYQALLRSGVIVRPLKNYGLMTQLRVTIGTEEQNIRFIAALQSAIRA